MNRAYVDELIAKNKIGLLIKYLNENMNTMSINNIRYIFDTCFDKKCYDIFYFMLEHYVKKDIVDIRNDQLYNVLNLHYDAIRLIIDKYFNFPKALKYIIAKYFHVVNTDFNYIISEFQFNRIKNVSNIKLLTSDVISKHIPLHDESIGYPDISSLCRSTKSLKYITSDDFTNRFTNVKYIFIKRYVKNFGHRLVKYMGKMPCTIGKMRNILYDAIDGYLCTDFIVTRYPIVDEII
jgi:hypothetical protein